MILKVGLILLSFFPIAEWENEVKQIDEQIQALTLLQEKYRSSAQRGINNAMRWQFQNQNYLDARRTWEKVAQDKQKIKEIQDQIDDLDKRKQEILKNHDPTPSP